MTAEPVSSYRCRLTIDHSRVRNTDQQNFPVLIRLCDPALAQHHRRWPRRPPPRCRLLLHPSRWPHPAAPRTGRLRPRAGPARSLGRSARPIVSPRRSLVSVLRRFGRCRNGVGSGHLERLVWSGATRGAGSGRLKRHGVGRGTDRGGVGAGDGTGGRSPAVAGVQVGGA